MYDLIIIGGGPAGISAGIYAARKKLNTLLITKDFWGQAGKASEVENYPGFEEIKGIELMEKFKKHLKKFDIEIREQELVKEIKKTKDGFIVKANHKEEYQAKAVIITSGRDPRPLEVPGEKELIGKGVSYCAICDAPFFKDKQVVVVGGGNAGFETAFDLAKYARKVYILETGSKVRADEINQEKAVVLGNIGIILNARIKEIKGKEKVHSLIYEDLAENGQSGNMEMPADGIFIEIGSIPATNFLKDLVDFSSDKDEIVIDLKTCATKTPGLFAAGDVTDVKYKQIVIATGEGAKAALSAYEYIQNMKSEA